MRTDTPVTVYRKDYQPYPYDIPEVSLGFDLAPESTEVRCVMQVRRKRRADAALVLDGEELELVSVGVDGSPLPADRYHLAEHSLALYGLPETATVEIVSRCCGRQLHADGPVRIGRQLLHPVRGRGLSPHHLVRRPPRRDVALPRDAAGHGRLPRAAVQRQPAGLAPAGRRPQRSRMGRPFPKPCYLFALVAGKLTHRETTVRTASGRDVLLQVYSDPGSEDKTEWALDSLVRAALGRDPLRTGAGPGPLHGRGRARLQHGGDGEQGPEHLQRGLCAGRRPDRHRRQL